MEWLTSGGLSKIDSCTARNSVSVMVKTIDAFTLASSGKQYDRFGKEEAW